MYSEYILYNLNKTKKIMHHYVDRMLKKEGFTDFVSAYGDILTVLFLNDGELKMNEISEMVGKDKSTVTVLINKLVEKNYVNKNQSQEDKRVFKVSLTDKAMTHKAMFNKIANNVRAVAFDGFSPEEEQAFKGYLKKLEGNFNQALKDV